MHRTLGEPAFHYRTVDTTMRVASEWARSGCPEGTVVTADQQTQGRGRLGRDWISQPNQGLYLSLVLRPTCRPGEAPLLTLAVGLGVHEALEEVARVSCDIRWPNDILIRERKCCGILVEMETEKSAASHVIVGIGLNLNHEEFPAKLASTATSLRIETKRPWSREEVQAPLLEAVGRAYDLYLDRGPQPILEAFRQASSYAAGRRVVIEDVPGEPNIARRGVTAGLDASGFLLLRDCRGQVAPIVAGSVRPDRGTMDEDAAGG